MVPPGFENKVLHATFRLGENTFMAADGSEAGLGFNGFLLSVVLPTATEADRAFAALSAGGRVKMPLAKTFWAPRYGVLTDRFGLGWKISVEA
jgi:PhnB protein